MEPTVVDTLSHTHIHIVFTACILYSYIFISNVLKTAPKAIIYYIMAFGHLDVSLVAESVPKLSLEFDRTVMFVVFKKTQCR